MDFEKFFTWLANLSRWLADTLFLFLIILLTFTLLTFPILIVLALQ